MKCALRLLPLVAVLALSGCLDEFLDGSEGGVVLEITDAPVDSLEQVRLSISAVELLSDDRGDERFEFDPPLVISDLLALQGGATRVLVNEDELRTGTYDGVRLFLNDDDSWVEDDQGARFDLFTPGQAPAIGGNDYLQADLSWRVREDDTTSLILDLDARQAIWRPDGEDFYLLVSATTLLLEAESASLSGTVAEDWLNDGGCTNDLAADKGNAVYLYPGSAATPGDMFLNTSGDRIDNTSPTRTATVTQDAGSGAYEYEFPFLSPGSYTLALTCQALDDTPQLDEPLQFVTTLSASLDAGENPTLDFAAP
jgi:hypothetical protein